MATKNDKMILSLKKEIEIKKGYFQMAPNLTQLQIAV